MKQLCFVLLAALVVLSSTESFAWSVKDESGTLLKVGGHMQYRGRYYDLDFRQDPKTAHQRGSLNRHNYYGDLSLGFEITPNENVKVFFEFSKLIFLGQRYRYNTIQTGEEVMPEDLAWALPDGTQTKLPLQRNTDEAWEMHMRQAWMDITFPGTKMKLKFGRQPFILGNGIYTNTNIASVFGYQFHTDLGKGKPVFRAGAMKYYEGVRGNFEANVNSNDTDDADVFFLDLSVPVDKSKLGVFLTHFRDSSQDL
ncbi:MAG: hypothetical protein U9N45_06020, partial [Gemmatimonadota bacterium]|nr:hypothetical protein [Gemmatimonadota bacterium]